MGEFTTIIAVMSLVPLLIAGLVMLLASVVEPGTPEPAELRAQREDGR